MKKITEKQLKESVSLLSTYMNTMEAYAPGTAPVPGSQTTGAWDSVKNFFGNRPAAIAAQPSAPAKPAAPVTGQPPAAGATLPDGSVSSGDAALDARLAAGVTAQPTPATNTGSQLGNSQFAQTYKESTQFTNTVDELKYYSQILAEAEQSLFHPGDSLAPDWTGRQKDTMDISGNARANQRKPTGSGSTKISPFPADTSRGPGSDASSHDMDSLGIKTNTIDQLGDMPSVNQPTPITPDVNTAPIPTIPVKSMPKPDPIVKQAQQGLIQAGLLPRGSDDGIMGKQTQDAYAKYSKQYPTTMQEHVSFGQDPELTRILAITRH